MKYHTLSTSSLASEGKKSTLTIYTNPDFLTEKMSANTQEAIIRFKLEMAQRALKLQTGRCRQLVAEFTRKLQEKDMQLITEKQLRDDQLKKVIRSLLVFESRLKQEQTLLKHELMERDDTISRQKKEIKRLRFTIQFCKSCSQFVNGSDSCDDSSEYYAWESGSEISPSVTDSYRNSSSGEESKDKVTYEKNKNCKNDYKRKKYIPRRATGTYLDVLKLHESEAESIIEDQEPNSLQTNLESIPDESFSSRMDSLHGIKKSPSPTEEKLENISNGIVEITSEALENTINETTEIASPKIKISETITVFDSGENESNDWYASASDIEDDDQRDIYRNNPVLECMNQILLQNINDANTTPPQSPEMDRNLKNKTQKRVKFSDEKIEESTVSYIDAIESKKSEDYYETPIQVNNNFYEVPQSIYSNDYEQIMSKCGSDSPQSWPKKENMQEHKINKMTNKMSLVKSNNLENLENKHYYVDMDIKTPSPTPRENIPKKKSRTPPALPPKPANLVSKFKIAKLSKSCENLDNFPESEPDYCSISELNLPPQKLIISNKPVNENTSLYDPISLDGPLASLVSKSQEKNNMQAPRQPKNERLTNLANIAQINMLKNKKEPEIPKLPQVSEIIIPDENEEKKVEHISQDNYIKNNSQLLKQRAQSIEKLRGPIVIGSSVSSLITGFNNHILTEIGSRKTKTDRLFSNFERSQSFDKHLNITVEKAPVVEKFDLSQNFEEFNLDDCEIGEDFQSENSDSISYQENIPEISKEPKLEEPKPEPKNTSVEIVRATNTVQSPHSIHSLQQLQKNLNCQKHLNEVPKVPSYPQNSHEPSYEHFLECTGLSSKSILTPSRKLSNHKSMLKPKDIKFRSKFKSAVFEYSGSTTKYWSEPYL